MHPKNLYPSAVPAPVLRVVATLKRAGFQAVIVGGAVRDLLLSRETNDWDVASNAPPEVFLQLFPRCHPTGLKHGTVTVVEEDLPIEVTTFRGESAYTDGRRPDEVRFGVPLEEDLARRDLTINALAWDPLTNTLFDPFHGADDLQHHLVRAVGDPFARFTEDGLRPMRAIRIATTLGFEVEQETLAAIPKAIPTFRKVSVERIRDELLKILAAPRPSRGLELLRQTGLLWEFLPELKEQVDCGQNRFHAHDVWNHSIRAVDATLGNVIWRLAALLHDVAKPQTKTVDEKGEIHFYRHESVGAPIAEEIGKRLRLSNEETETLSALVAQHMFHYTPEMSDAAVRRFIRKTGEKILPGLFALRRGDVLARGRYIAEGLSELVGFQARVERILSEKAPLSTNDLAISGHDLMAAGVPHGPKIGKVLRSLLERVIEDPSQNTRENLLTLLPEILEQTT